MMSEDVTMGLIPSSIRVPAGGRSVISNIKPLGGGGIHYCPPKTWTIWCQVPHIKSNPPMEPLLTHFLPSQLVVYSN